MFALNRLMDPTNTKHVDAGRLRRVRGGIAAAPSASVFVQHDDRYDKVTGAGCIVQTMFDAATSRSRSTS